MWPDTPEQRLMYITQRQAELRAEAAAHRASRTRTDAACTYRVKGLHLHLGTLLIVIGRNLREEDGSLLHPAR
jgi:hypothetical protein